MAMEPVHDVEEQCGPSSPALLQQSSNTSSEGGQDLHPLRADIDRLAASNRR